jgi:hypothetical protein
MAGAFFSKILSSMLDVLMGLEYLEALPQIIAVSWL